EVLSEMQRILHAAWSLFQVALQHCGFWQVLQLHQRIISGIGRCLFRAIARKQTPLILLSNRSRTGPLLGYLLGYPTRSSGGWLILFNKAACTDCLSDCPPGCLPGLYSGPDSL